jgi:hypothetical protein
MLKVTMSSDVRNQILLELEAVLDAFRDKHDGWAGWCGGVLDHVKQQLQGPINVCGWYGFH